MLNARGDCLLCQHPELAPAPPAVYPTEPVDVDHELGTYRVWQNGPNWWVANVDGIGEWSGPTRESVVASAEEALRNEDDPAPPAAADGGEKGQE